MKGYKHLGVKEREKIYFLKQSGESTRQIALKLKRSASTISREVERNSYKGHYLPDRAQQFAQKRYHGRRRSILPETSLYFYLLRRLQKGWSPEQISGRMKLENHSQYVCHETIYQYIYKGRKGKDWYKYLTKAKPKRGKRKGRKVGSGKFLHVRLISKRPSCISKRDKLGHWEIDTIRFHSSPHTNITTLVERKSRYTLMIKNCNRQSDHVLTQVKSVIDKAPRFFKTLTCDQGSEFAHVNIIENTTKCLMYFCDPHSPWQKGTNENMNGRIRRYLPRHVDIDEISSYDIDSICKKLNNTPRKILGFRAPRELIPLPKSNLVALLS